MRTKIIIVGGGPAGGMLAWNAARSGFSVTLLEASPILPERVCGAYLCPAGVRLLADSGVLERLTAGCRELTGMLMVSPEGLRAYGGFPHDGSGSCYGLALHRPEFDRGWLELAREAGAEVIMGARVHQLHQDGNDGWRVRCLDGREFSANLLVGADGRKSFVARHLGLLLPPPRTRAAAHLDMAPRHPLPPFGQMHVFADGSYVGLNPLAVDRVNVSFVCHPEILRSQGAAGWLNSRLEGTALGEQLPRVESTARFGVTFPAAAMVSAAATRNAALIGDASGFIDPLTGEGIYNALWTARSLSSALARHPENPALALRVYAHARRRTQWSKALLSQLFQSIISRPRMANAVLRLLAGHSGVTDAFIGIIGNTHSPAHGLVRMVLAALGPQESPLSPTAHAARPH